jgi:hypothetical protein
MGYVEDFDEPRTKLANFFSILLLAGDIYGWVAQQRRDGRGAHELA